MKRIISFVLCLSMLFSMLPVSVFASTVEESEIAETTAVTEAPQAEETAAPAEAPVVDTAAAPTTVAAEETAAAAEIAAETTEATEAPSQPAETTAATEETTASTEPEETTWEYTYIPDLDLPGNEELFAMYAEQKLYGTDFAFFGIAAGQRLSGDEKLAYDALVPVIKDIANGDRASSVVSVGYNGDIPVTFSGSGSEFDINGLLSALLSDLPYDLYWFDKTCGISMSFSSSASRLKITFNFYVAANYSSSGGAVTCDLDTAKTSAATTAVTNAKAIVEENASKSDYEKLLAYKNKICSLTSYNTSAANSGNFSGNDDPWQVIYVFDGLQSTKVVCEGYAKAFQYLCDLSVFSGDVTCYNVSGVMSGGTGAGAHMWNIVTIGGQNYLVDVTNSDTGTVGENGKLFLAGKAPNADGSYTIGSVKFTYNDETKELWGTDEGSILNLASENYDPSAVTAAPPTTAEELLTAVSGGGEVTVWDAITVTEDMTLSSGSLLSFADYAKLTVASGVTLTLNCPTNINGAELIVEEGAKLISNVDLTINDPQGNGGKAIINGDFENNGSMWVNTGSLAELNGYAYSTGPIFVGFGGGGRLNINGQLDTTGYLCVNEGGELNLPSGAKLNLLGAGGGYLDNAGNTWLGGDVYIEGLMSSGARRDEETGEVVGADANIEIRGTVTGTDTSLIAVGEKGSISCYGPVTTAGEVVVEQGGAFWVDNTVTLTGPAPLTVNGWLHIDFFDEYATADGLLNLETTANVNGYLHVCDGGNLNVTDKAVLNILNDENGCGYLDNQGHVGMHGTMNLNGLFTTGAACDENGTVVGNPADTELRGSINASETSSIGVLADGNLNCFGPVTTAGEVKVEPNGALWVDNTVSINGPAPFVNNGAVHVDFFDQYAAKDGVLNVNTETLVNGYWAVHDGGTLNVGENATVGIYNNENGCGYLDNQGTVTMDGHLYLEGLFTTGAACDENGNVVGAPATARFNWYVDTTETSFFGVLNGGTVSVSGVNNAGEFRTEAGGKLIFPENVCLDNHGGTVSMEEGTTQFEGLNFVMNHLVDGRLGSVSGVPYENLVADVHAYSADEVYALFETASPEEYCDITAIVENSMVLDRDLTIPEVGFINVVAWEVPFTTVTIPEGVTITNNGYIYVLENTELVVNGILEGNQPESLGGTVTGGFYETTFEELKEQLRPGSEVWLNNDLVLTDDLIVPVNASLHIEGAVVTVAEGVEIFNYGLIEVSGDPDGNRGILNINGGLSNYHTGGCLNILSDGVVNVNGTVYNGTVTNVLGGKLVINGSWEGYGPIAADGGVISGGGAPSPVDALEQLLNSSAANGYPVQLNTGLVLTRDLTIPAGANLTIGEGGKLTVPGGKTLTVEGELHVTESVDKYGSGDAGLLLESGKLVNNGLIAVHDLGLMEASNGTYEQAEWAELHWVFWGDAENFVSSDIVGIPHEYVTHIGDGCNPQVFSTVLRNAEHAASLGTPFGHVRLNVSGSITLSEDMTIPENGTLSIAAYSEEPVVLTVPSGVTLTNNGRIEIGWNSKLLIKNGGKFTGGQPVITDFGGEFVNSSSYTEADLRADIAKAAGTGKEIFLNSDITLTQDLRIPENVMLTISGGAIRIPAGITLTNDGQITATLLGGIFGQGGTLQNNALINCMNEGVLDMQNGTYLQSDWADVYNIHTGDAEGNIMHATVLIPPQYITFAIEGTSEALIHEILAHTDGMVNDGNDPEAVYVNIHNGEIRLTEDLTVPDYAVMNISDFGTMIVPAGVTLTNNGNIDIGWAGRLVIEEGGAIVGSHPICYDTGSEYINCNTYDQDYLEALIADAQASGKDSAVLSVPVKLTSDMEIPSGFRLQITGRDNFITIPKGVTLTNNGQITCQMFGGILGQGGTLVNDGPIHVLNWGTVDMWDGEYIPWGNGMVYNHHARYTDGYEEHATVVGFHPFHVVVITGSDEDSILHELIDFIDHVSQDGYYSNLSSNVMGDMTLTGDLYWPGYATMTIPEGLTVTIPKGVTLDNWGTIFVYGKLIVEGTLTGKGQIIAGSTDCIIGNTDSNIAVPGVALEDYTIGISDPTTNVGGSARVWVETVEPAYAEFYGYYDIEIVAGDGWISEDRVYSNTPGTVTVAVKPIVGYDSENDYASIYPDTIKTIDITFVELGIGHFFSDSPDFFENYGTPDGSYGLWAGDKATFYPVLMNVSGEVVGTDGITATYSEGYEKYATIAVKNGNYTVTALKTLATHEVISITFTAEGAAPATVNFHLRPKAGAADIQLNGKTVTGSTVTIDANGSDPVRQLSGIVTPFDTIPVDGVLIEGVDASDKPMCQWTSSNTAVATVDESGLVTFTGEAGTVKITLTTNYGATKTAAVTFKAVALAQEILPAANLTAKLIGGKAATYSVTDGQGNALKANAVQWYLVDEQGNPMASNPYASIDAKGKLTTKAVADPYEVYIMAKVIGTEDSATLAKPITVTLYPAVSSIEIVDPIDRLIKNWTMRWDFTEMENEPPYQLSWTAAPYAEAVQSVTWSSSKTDIATIDKTGLITATGKPGTVKFTLTVVALDGKKSTASVTFKFGIFTKELDMYAKLPNGDRQQLIIGQDDNLTIYGGESITFEAYSIPEKVTTGGVTWSLYDAADKAYASISAKGVLKTKAVTNPKTIYVSVFSKDGHSGYIIDVTILPKNVKVEGEIKEALLIQNDIGEYITKSTITLTPNTTTWLYATEDVTWISSKPGVAQIDENGKLTALMNGSTTITATAADGRKAIVNVKVGKVAESIDITAQNGADLVVASGKSLNLIGTVTYSDGSTDKQVTWTLDWNDCGAKITAAGKLTAPKGLTGPTSVSAVATSKDGFVMESVEVEIVPLATGVEVFGPFNTAGSGQYDVDVSNTTQKWDMATQGSSFYLYAGVFSYDAIQDVTWKSSSNKVAVIDADGKVTCMKAGTVTITATAKDGSGKKASFKLNVYRSMTYLTLPEDAIIGSGKSLTMTKLDGYAIDSTATNKTLVWSMTDKNGNAVPKSIATLSSKGVLKAGASVAMPITVYVRAEAADGSGCFAECAVTIFPVTRGITLYSINENGGLINVTGKTVTAPINEGYCILTDTTNVAGFDYIDDKTADEYLPNGSAWKITSSDKLRVEYDGQAVCFYPTENAKVGDSIKITIAATDGSGKKATFTIHFA